MNILEVHKINIPRRKERMQIWRLEAFLINLSNSGIGNSGFGNLEFYQLKSILKLSRIMIILI